MYSILLVSRDERFRDLAGKFIPRIDRNIDLHLANGGEAALLALNGSPGTEVVVFYHTLDNNVVDFLELLGRSRVDVPVMVVAQDTGQDLTEVLVNSGVQSYMPRGNREVMEFFTELCGQVVMNAERRRNERERRINERRMAAMIEMAKMDHSDFQHVVEFALEKSIELTGSEIGYVSLYDRERNILRMLAWSKGAMKTCAVSNYPIEFDLNTTGIWGEPVRLGRTIVVNDYVNDSKAMKKGTPMGHVELRRLLMVPILIDKVIVGTAGVGNKPSEYTWVDEKQMKLLMEDLFDIHNKIETSKRQAFHMDVISRFIETGPMGLLFVDAELDVVVMNDLARAIIGATEMPEHFRLDMVHTTQADDLIKHINTVRKSDEPMRSRILMSESKMNLVYETFVQMSQIDRTRNGFLVLFNDVSDLLQVDSDNSRIEDHVSVLEGPVLSALVSTITGMDPADPPEEDIHRLRNIILFMNDYRLAGKNRAAWGKVESIVDKAVRASSLGDVELVVRSMGIEILADPAFPLVFKHLIDNSVDHGGDVTRIEIRCRISRGNMTIVYTDNGSGVPDNIRDRIFNLTSEGKFGMFLVTTIVRSSGMSVRCVPSKEGAQFEIDVPPECYSLE